MPIPTIHGQAGVLEDPELRYTQSQKPVANTRLAFNDSRYDEQTRQWENTRTFYVDATAWEHAAERMTELIRKGDQVYVEGRIETQQWEDKDGNKRSKPVLQLRTIRKFEKPAPKPQGQQQGFDRPAGQKNDPWSGAGNTGDWSTPSADSVPF